MPKFDVRFKLNVPACKALRSTFDPGIMVTAEQRSDELWIRGVDADTPEAAVGRAREMANCVLDALAVDAGQAHEILPVHVRIEFEGKALVCTGIEARVRIEASPSIPVEVQPLMLDAATFFRRALIAEREQSWFEAMREYFRAIEYIATSMEDCRNVGKALVSVLRKYCADPKRCEQLRQVAVQCPGFPCENSDLAAAVANYLYRGHRCELAHAQALAKKGYKKPFDPEDERMVREALPVAKFVAAELIKMYRDLGGS